LIKQGVKLVETAQDVLDELPLAAAAPTPHRSPDPRPPPAAAAGAPDDPLLQALGHDPVTLDALCARTGLETASLLARLLALELEGTVARLPGGLYQRIAQT
jgi:DNA processing protein